MIARVWHGYTTPENASKYEAVLNNQVIPGISDMKIEGYHKIEVLRKDGETEVEFITIMYFDSINSVKNFIGDDYEVAHVPDIAKSLLKRFDKRSAHYTLQTEITYK
jgi:hypothetical protein